MEELDVEQEKLRRIMRVAFCVNCKRETEHNHMISSPYGMDGMYMSGSERYECKECGHAIFYGDARGKEEYKSLNFTCEGASDK